METNSEREILVAGFGGQGIVLIGSILGKAAAIHDLKHATMIQAYGPEARGGSCSSQVIISEEEIAYPYVQEPQVLMCMSQEGFEKNVGSLLAGGLLIWDTDLVNTGELDSRMDRLPYTRHPVRGETGQQDDGQYRHVGVSLRAQRRGPAGLAASRRAQLGTGQDQGHECHGFRAGPRIWRGHPEEPGQIGRAPGDPSGEPIMSVSSTKVPRKGVLLLGSGYGALKVAEDVAQAGIPVVWVTRAQHFLELPQGLERDPDWPEDLDFQFRPLYLRVTRHPLVTTLTQARVRSLGEVPGRLPVVIEQDPIYVDYDLCTGCSRCMELSSGAAGALALFAHAGILSLSCSGA